VEIDLADAKRLEEMAEEEHLRLTDPVAYIGRVTERMDKHYRPTFFKLNKDGMGDLIPVGNWIVDPEGIILDIVHLCDGEFSSPTVMVSDNRKSHTLYKDNKNSKREKWSIVCVTCGAKPTEDVNVVMELLKTRKENMNYDNAPQNPA